MLWDPFGAIADALKAAYDQLIVLFEWLILNPRSLQTTPLGEFLAGNAIGAAPLLAGMVFGVLLVLALFGKRFRLGFVKAALILLAVVVIGPIWYEIVAALENVGDGLSVATQSLFERPDGSASGVLPTLNAIDAFWGVIIFGWACFFGTTLVFMFVLYEWVTVATAFLGLLSFALIALGDRARKVFLGLVSIAIVTMVIGRPVAMLLLELGRAFSGVLSDAPNSISIVGVVTVGSLLLAFLAQIVLFFLMYKGVSSVAGRIDAVVTGTVKAISDVTLKESQKSVITANINSIKGRPEVVNRTLDYSKTVRDVSIAAGTAKAATLLTTRAAASATPAGAAFATVASIAVKEVPKLVTKTVRK